MIPVTFGYLRVGSVDEAVAALSEYGDDAKLLAGGHSLLPLMKLRLATPAVVVDIGRLDALRYVEDRGEHIAVGALTCHRDIERSDLLARRVGLLARAAGEVGDPQVRNRGTIGGSVVHGDSASDLPAVLLALGATLVVAGPSGTRTIPVDGFFQGFLETALAPDELLVEIRVPVLDHDRWSFQKFTRRAQDWAIVGVAAADTASGARVALVNMAATPVRATSTEDALRGGSAADVAAELAADGTSPSSDLGASEEYRRHLARVLVGRALRDLAVPA